MLRSGLARPALRPHARLKRLAVSLASPVEPDWRSLMGSSWLFAVKNLLRLATVLRRSRGDFFGCESPGCHRFARRILLV